MNIKLYRQRKSTKPSGRIIFQGEDTHPYADNELIIVADGLGGRGGFPHMKMNEEILDKDKLYGLMFDPVFPHEVDDSFKDFVVNNFEELFITEDYYFDEEIEYIDRYDPREKRMVKLEKPTYPYVRCSGYFASRIVTAIALYELKYNPIFKRDAVFSNIAEMTEEQRDEYAMELGRCLADSIREKLPTVAENVGFTIEMDTENKGVYLLPTTLTVTLYNERENDVEALYLWAGDTRGYIWDEVAGMGQVTEDHEQDETMTNLITLSKPFGVEGRFITASKPCVLFNASDGVYKPPVFASPIDQECLMLQAFNGHPELEDALKYLETAYNHVSPDDSSTLALVPFGYSDYEELRGAVKRRLDVIGEKYLSRLPDLFDRDYPAELKRLDDTIMNMDGLKDELIKVDAIYNVVREEMLMRGYAPYNEARRAAGADVLRLEEDKKAAERDIVLWVEKNWVRGYRLKRLTSAAGNYIDGECPYDTLRALSDAAGDATREHHAVVRELSKEVTACNEIIAGLIFNVSKSVERATSPESYEGYDDAREKLLSALEFIDSLRSGEADTVKKYTSIRQRMSDLCDEYVRADADAVSELVIRILGAEEAEALNIGEKCCAELKPLHRAYLLAKEGCEKCSGADGDLESKFVLDYWNESGRLLGLIWNSYRDLIPDHIYERVLANDPERLAKRNELVEGNRIRGELYALYNETYFRMYRESRI